MAGILEPDPQSAFDAFASAARHWRDRPFLVVLPETAKTYGIAAETLSYGAMLDMIERRRVEFERAAYASGDRVGLLLENRPSFFVNWLALNALGVSVVPINPDLRSAELEHLVAHSGMVAAVALSARHESLQRAAAAGRRSLALSAPEALPTPLRAATVSYVVRDEGTECALLYTSGTTGLPKGCVLTNDYYLRAGRGYRDIGGLCAFRPGEERLLTPLPLFHMNPMAYSVMAMIMTGGCLIVLDRFHPKTWWESVRSPGATIVHYLGVMPAMLMGAPASDADRDHSVRFGFGAGCPAELHAAFEARFGFPLIEGWAMTETGAGAVITASHEPRHVGTSCFGRASAAVETRIVTDDGHEAGADEPGELLVRAAGPEPRRGFFREYLDDPEATAAAWEGGWFHSGDIVRRDAGGNFRFVDRKKNVIRRSGENIAAVEVEGVLLKHPAVAAAGVTAVPDAVRGDEVMALIVARQNAGPPSQELARAIAGFCRERLAYYKAPGHVAFVDTLPVTATQKVQRGELKALARSLVGTPAAYDLTSLKKRTA